jgi:hypothetical protein
MRYLPLLLLLTACHSAAPLTDAGAEQPDRHLLTFDTGTDAITPNDGAGDDATSPTDAEADTLADSSPSDVMQSDLPWWVQTDAGLQCDGGVVDCGPSTMCGVCLACCIDGSTSPGYCYTLPEWQYVKHCYLTFQCVI